MDPALYALDPVAPPADTAGGGTSDSVLVALRTDRDSTLREHGVSPLDGVNDDISATVEDLDEFLDRIRDVDTVVSDQLTWSSRR